MIAMIKILFICHGNICRLSKSAELPMLFRPENCITTPLLHQWALLWHNAAEPKRYASALSRLKSIGDNTQRVLSTNAPREDASGWIRYNKLRKLKSGVWYGITHGSCHAPIFLWHFVGLGARVSGQGYFYLPEGQISRSAASQRVIICITICIRQT